MRVVYVNFREETFGITQTSLKMLRDKLAEAIGHRLAVFEIPTSDLCCGFLILDWEEESATFTGDGFRMDRAGEGGAGYKTAEVLFRLFGIRAFPCDETLDSTELYRGDRAFIEKKLLGLAQKLGDVVLDSEFRKPLKINPEYIRV